MLCINFPSKILVCRIDADTVDTNMDTKLFVDYGLPFKNVLCL
jgi:hypothetical protein